MTELQLIIWLDKESKQSRRRLLTAKGSSRKAPRAILSILE